jgi:hypothetical protein
MDYHRLGMADQVELMDKRGSISPRFMQQHQPQFPGRDSTTLQLSAYHRTSWQAENQTYRVILLVQCHNMHLQPETASLVERMARWRLEAFRYALQNVVVPLIVIGRSGECGPIISLLVLNQKIKVVPQCLLIDFSYACGGTCGGTDPFSAYDGTLF